MLCISIGYPVEMVAQNGVENDGLIIETTATGQLTLTKDEAVVWANNYSGGNYTYSHNEESLHRKGILLIGTSIFQLLHKLSSLKPIRQGAGVYTQSAKSPAYSFTVCIGDSAYIINNRQKALWCSADGVNTLSDIIENNRCSLICSESELYKDICELLRAGILFFR